MSDLNFSCRLQEQTSFKANPYPVVLTLQDPELFNYPFYLHGGGIDAGISGWGYRTAPAISDERRISDGG